MASWNTISVDLLRSDLDALHSYLHMNYPDILAKHRGMVGAAAIEAMQLEDETAGVYSLQSQRHASVARRAICPAGTCDLCDDRRDRAAATEHQP